MQVSAEYPRTDLATAMQECDSGLPQERHAHLALSLQVSHQTIRRSPEPLLTDAKASNRH